MEEAYYADRVQLQRLLQQYPTWTGQQYAEATGRSLGWVKKWRGRLRAADGNPDALRSRSRRPHKTPTPIQEPVIRRILDIRDHPPQHLQRTPGPLAIRYYLQQDEALKASGLHIPTSTSTLWRILDQHQRIQRSRRLPHEPLERPEPMRCWQLDFKDVSTVPPDPDGKQQHAVETMNLVDEGTSRVVGAVVRADFTMESTLEAVVEVLQEQGLPEQIQFDRDPRFVGSWTGRDFPSPFVRFWQNLGVNVRVCPPKRPDKNAFVERYHRNYSTECLRVEQPSDLLSSVEVTARYVQHYNQERPNQALACANQPPDQAFPNLPRLPRLPQQLDPDRWLTTIQERFRGQSVNLRVQAPQRQLLVEHRGQLVKTLNIKGLVGQPSMSFDAYSELMLGDARTHWRRLKRHRR
jgi:hypothetical protein